MASLPTSDIAIVGAGPVGSLLAVLLARRGHRVTVFERRGDFRQGAQGAGRSINLVLTRRGIRALERAGLAAGALALTVPVTGRMMHGKTGELAYQPYGRDDSECNYSISRGELNRYLVDQATDQGVRFRFDARLSDGDIAAGRLTFCGPDQQTTQVAARPIFGADGGGSTTRSLLHGAGLLEESVAMLEHGYKELSIPAGDDGSYRLDEHALHIWPRGRLMLMALANQDGSFTVTLYLPLHGEFSFEAVADRSSLKRLFEEHFADAIPLIPDLDRAYFEHPVGSLGTVRCRPWTVAGNVVLIGDAAHGIVPFFGQGMNAGFEDCRILDELLGTAAGSDWGEIFVEFERRRKTDTDAIADMALENFVEMSERVADEGFLLRKQVEHRMEQAFPQEYRSRYSMVMYSQIPFRVAFDAGQIQSAILDELCHGLTSAEALDLGQARDLVRSRLAPWLRRHDVNLDY